MCPFKKDLGNLLTAQKYTYYWPSPRGNLGQIQLCLGTSRGVWKIAVPWRWEKRSLAYNNLVPWAKLGAFYKEIKSITRALKLRLYTCQPLVQKIAGWSLSSGGNKGRLGELSNLRFCYVHQFEGKVLFSNQLSWVNIMASQVYYGCMLFNISF